MKSIDESLADSPFIFPTEADLKKVHVTRSLTAEEETSFNSAFQKVVGA
jgi:spermidine/putrescine transport system substrate-binding protein